MPILAILLINTVIVVSGLYVLMRLLSPRRPPLPPGPSGLPVIGNLFDLPKKYDWYHWAKHKELYGPISSVSVFGQNHIIINDQKCATDLLEKKSAIYSDRPRLPFRDMCGWGYVTTFLQHGNDLTTHRKNIRQTIATKEAIAHVDLIEELEVRRFLARVLEKPDSLHSEIRTMAAAIILQLAYGYSVETQGPDPLVQVVDKAIEYLIPAAQQGVWLVDSIPILKYIPVWFPGAHFKRFARESREYVQELVDRPHQFVKQQINMGTEQPSFTSFFMGQNPSAEEEVVNQWAAATMFIGGTETSLSAIHAFFLAMTLYPEVQEKAQAEIDSVVGSARLPAFSDRASLTYVEAMVSEVLRWHTVVPMNPAHVATSDDIYRGYLIPKGSMVLVNLWMINHDPNNFPDPFSFQPERFLSTDLNRLDPHRVSFGYGRRECPGKRLADTSLFLSIAMSLATLTVRKALDKSGCEIVPKYEPKNTFGIHNKTFQCMIAARSAKARDLILSVQIEDKRNNLRDEAATLLNLESTSRETIGREGFLRVERVLLPIDRT